MYVYTQYYSYIYSKYYKFYDEEWIYIMNDVFDKWIIKSIIIHQEKQLASYS